MARLIERDEVKRGLVDALLHMLRYSNLGGAAVELLLSILRAAGRRHAAEPAALELAAQLERKVNGNHSTTEEQRNGTSKRKYQRRGKRKQRQRSRG